MGRHDNLRIPDMARRLRLRVRKILRIYFDIGGTGENSAFRHGAILRFGGQ